MLKTATDDSSWQHPKELLKIQKLKFKKQALQERIKGNLSPGKAKCGSTSKEAALENILSCKKRNNPFIKDDNPLENPMKKTKPDDNLLGETLDPSLDQTLFKLFNQDLLNVQNTSVTTFSNIFTKASSTEDNPVGFVNNPAGTSWCPIDWTLKRKIRLISLKPFPWSQKLKICEEASGVTSFTRCLDMEQCDTFLDVSPNAKFHQCCLYWQQPFLPWLSLFPRNNLKNSSNGINLGANTIIKNSLYNTWTDSLKSLFQLIRTRQCPYFYVCANSFTAIFRAAGIFGHTDVHVMVTPTTRGFRHLLKEEDIDFKMPLKPNELLLPQDHNDLQNGRTMNSLENKLHDDNALDEKWLTDLGINADDIKSINYTQARIEHKTECQVDSSDQSLVLIEGVEVNAFFNFLINCKSAIAPTGPLAGVPPTLLAPVSFHGATLNSLKVKESKIHSDEAAYYSLEITGPILPSTLHNIFNINEPNHSITMTFSDVESTRGFSKVVRNNQKKTDVGQGTIIFGKENLSDCGLNRKILKHFCSGDPDTVCNVECLKYSGETKSFTWS